MSALFVVPPAFAKTLHPRRGWTYPELPTLAAIAKQLARTGKAYTTPPYPHEKRTLAGRFEAGLEHEVEPELMPLRRAVHALLKKPDIEKVRAADLDVLAAAETVLTLADSKLTLTVPVAVVRGFADAVRVAVGSTRFGIKLDRITRAELSPRRGSVPWPELRAALCAAPDPEYEDARAFAAGYRETAPVLGKAYVAYLFPDEPWATELLRTDVDDDPRGQLHLGFLLTATDSVEAVRRHVEKRGRFWLAQHALNVAYSLPWQDALAIFAEALPALLTKPKYGPLLKTEPRMIAQAVACFRRPEAAAILAPYASHAVLAPIVLGYFRDAPELAAVVAPGSDAAIERTVGRVLASKQAKAAPVADASDVPPLLRDRPWRLAPMAKGERRMTLALEVLGAEEGRVIIEPQPPFTSPYGIVRDMTPAELATWRAQVGGDVLVHADYSYVRVGDAWEYLRVPDDDVLRAWNETNAILTGGAERLVATHGLAAIPGFLRREWIDGLQYTDSEPMLPAAMALVSPLMAPQMARVAARRKNFRRTAQGWLLTHARIAALGLVPDALGKTGEARADAEAALVYLKQKGVGEVVLEAASRYGEVAHGAIARLLARDPLRIGATVPKPPEFLREKELPPVLTRSGSALDVASREALLEMLQVSPLDPPYPGLPLVVAGCTLASLGAFAAGLLEQWLLGDAPGRHDWMLHALVHFPSEASERRVSSLARDWARRDHAKATRVCPVLAALGSPDALKALADVAETTGFDALRKTATALLAETR